MKISADNLASGLVRLSPIYLVAGAEPLLVMEAVDAIRARARDDGFVDRELYFVERGFDWHALRAGLQTLSLFSSRRLIELRMPQANPGETGTELLVDFAQQPAPDTIVVVVCEKLEPRIQSARWVTAIEQRGTWVQIWPVDVPRLPGWIRERLQRRGLRIDASAANALAARVEGNLLAAHQEIEKLALLLPSGDVPTETVLEVVADSARFDVLQVGEAAMRGQAARALRIVEGLQGEGTEPTILLWAINKDLQWIARVHQLVRQGENIDQALYAERVWKPRHAAMKQALARLNTAAIHALLTDAERVDRTIKGVETGNSWLQMHALVARFAGLALPRAA